jgi:hypothetical protein
MNLCRSCDTDFASVAAFDRHRTGTHEYTLSEGLRFEPPVEDGRRCMDVDEMLEAGMEVDPRGRWRIALTEADQARLATLSEGPYALQGSPESDTEV